MQIDKCKSGKNKYNRDYPVEGVPVVIVFEFTDKRNYSIINSNYLLITIFKV